ncbi:MAG: site-specific recombinase XerD [Halanaerobium sp. T82-1]|nr:MAG: site-specific recombinase XerD [Halanaerobium sp. T82-1]
MKNTDFSYYLTTFLKNYLPGEKGVSENTILSYRDTFILLLKFFKDRKNISAENITLEIITKDIIVDFLGWIEVQRHCSITTRNIRLAAMHSFFRYLQYQSPENLQEWQRILSIPVKKTEKATMNYLSLDGIKLLLEMPDQSLKSGQRNLAILSLMYDTAARVQEIIDLTPSNIRFDKPYTVKLIGKGKKARIVPLMEPTAEILKRYMEANGLLKDYANEYPLFFNSRKEKLTRAGVNYILKKYSKIAREKIPALIPEQISCHSLRHSKAMHLLQAGVNLVYIRDILGHSSVQVTEVYARADSRQKREAIEKAYTDVSPTGKPQWQENDDLLLWLNQFNQ